MNYEKFYLIGFWIATLYAFVMLPYNLERMQRVDSIEEKTTTNTELLETEEDWKENLSETLQTIWILIPSANASVMDVEDNGKLKAQAIQSNSQVISVENATKETSFRTPKQIYEQVKHLGYREAPTVSIIWACKAHSRDIQKCILVWLTLMYNEAGNKQNSKACIERNNCFGINSWKTVFKSYDEASERWVNTFNKWWYKADSAKYFYPDLWKVAPTKYCTDEKQHYPNIGCPDWQKIASDKWSKIYPIIY